MARDSQKSRVTDVSSFMRLQRAIEAMRSEVETKASTPATPAPAVVTSGAKSSYEKLPEAAASAVVMTPASEQIASSAPTIRASSMLAAIASQVSAQREAAAKPAQTPYIPFTSGPLSLRDQLIMQRPPMQEAFDKRPPKSAPIPDDSESPVFKSADPAPHAETVEEAANRGCWKRPEDISTLPVEQPLPGETRMPEYEMLVPMPPVSEPSKHYGSGGVRLETERLDPNPIPELRVNTLPFGGKSEADEKKQEDRAASERVRTPAPVRSRRLRR